MKMTLQDDGEMLVMEAECREEWAVLERLTWGGGGRHGGPLVGAVPILGEPEIVPTPSAGGVWYAQGCAPGYGRPMVGLTWSLKHPMHNYAGASREERLRQQAIHKAGHAVFELARLLAAQLHDERVGGAHVAG